jgi:lysyl-tRNA synthetase, class II
VVWVLTHEPAVAQFPDRQSCVVVTHPHHEVPQILVRATHGRFYNEVRGRGMHADQLATCGLACCGRRVTGGTGYANGDSRTTFGEWLRPPVGHHGRTVRQEGVADGEGADEHHEGEHKAELGLHAGVTTIRRRPLDQSVFLPSGVIGQTGIFPNPPSVPRIARFARSPRKSVTDGIAKDRLEKLQALRGAGQDPFPPRVPRGQPIASVLSGFAERAGQTVTLAGRLGVIRDFGKLRFAHLEDRSGSIQVGFQRDKLTAFWPDRKRIEGNDLVSITGELGTTQKGEPTLWATEVTLASKALRAAPEKWHGLTDTEQRYRMRYVDLFANPEVRHSFAMRSKIVREVRAYFDSLDYLEVETPILQPIFGGASARPFITHHNTLDMQLYLRIAPELYLKRLIVGGMERVYEIGRVFRNEGISTRHNPEFTMLESYEAWADYRDIMARVEGLFAHLCQRVLDGRTKVTFREKEFDLQPPFQKEKYLDLFAQQNPGTDWFEPESVLRRAKELHLKTDGIEPAKLANDVFEATVEDTLQGPIFVYDYPVAISPLAKRVPEDPRITERFELFVCGMELGNAFSELNDPIDQEQRFLEQMQHKDDETPGEVDFDYVTALEFGMPPAGGLGIGIDRLCMLLSGSTSIRDVVLFPLLRRLDPQAGAAASGEGDSPAASPAPTDTP